MMSTLPDVLKLYSCPPTKLPVCGLRYYEPSECVNVSMHKVACYRTREGIDGVLQIPWRNLRLPISVFELTKNEVGESSMSLAGLDRARFLLS